VEKATPWLHPFIQLMSTLIKLENISKTYKNVIAADNISLEIKKGQVFGIIGPNGAGKTTTLSIILGLVKHSSGSINILGYSDPEQARKFIGATLETIGFYSEFSAYKNLKLSALARNSDFSRINKILELVGLSERKFDTPDKYSFGMKQRLAIAQALIGNREIIILDEPTNGLDPRGIIEIRELILNLKQEGRTVIIASHLLNEMEKICTDVAIFNKGKVVWNGKLSDVLSQYQTLENAFMQITNK
jgi:ABC-2 type transport system ATP-binding protein